MPNRPSDPEDTGDTDPSRPGTDDRLPCGAAVEDLLTQVVERLAPRDPQHQGSCPHCRASLAELASLWAPVHGLAAEEVPAPTGLLERVMAQVRELARHTWHAVIPGPTGSTRVAARVVGAIARLAAESVPHVGFALGSGGPDPAHAAAAGGDTDPAAADAASVTDVGVAGTHVAVDIQIVVDAGVRIPEVARQVRHQITRHIAAQTGLTTARLNITVVDVHGPGSDATSHPWWSRPR